MSTEATLAMVQQLLAKSQDANGLFKADTFVQSTSATTGLTAYDLEAPAKNLYPVLSPLRNRIPRVSGRGGIQANWKAVTGLNVNQIYSGVAEGRRGQMVNHSTADYFAAYKTIGQESAVTFEADLAAETFDDLKARQRMMLLQSMMVEEELIILGGNTSVPLGTTPTPTLAVVTTGGAVAASTTVSVICIALSFDAYRRIASTTITGSVTVSPTITVTPTDGQGTYTTGAGWAQKSANATVTTGSGSSANSITAKVAPVRGAYGYAWFWGAAGSETLGAVTSTAFTTITTAAGAGASNASAFSSDNSTSAQIFDGLLSIVANPNFTGNWLAQTSGTGLTADGSAGIVEFDTILQTMWDKYRLQPNKMLVSSQEELNIRKKIMAVGGAANAVRWNFPVGPGNMVTGGGKPKGYLSPFTMTGTSNEIEIELHPNMPPGTVLFTSDTLPYPVNNVGNIMQIRARKDYYSMDWPFRSRQYEIGVYSDQVLQHYAPFSMGLITNIANA